MDADEYSRLLDLLSREDEIQHESNRRTAENHQRQSEEVIGNMSVLRSLRDDTDSQAIKLLENPT